MTPAKSVLLKMLMKTKQIFFWLILLVAGLNLVSTATSLTAASPPTPSDESDVRSAVQRIFEQLKGGQYDALYDSLPSNSRARISRDRLVKGLQGTRNMYQLDRIEIGSVRVSGNFAVVDTVMYARIAKPFDAEGKLVVQQYLVREDGSWRVATGDTATINQFLKSNPAFARKFQIKPTRAYIKQNGQWVEFKLPTRRQ
jgi:hypothetical protein